MAARTRKIRHDDETRGRARPHPVPRSGPSHPHRGLVMTELESLEQDRLFVQQQLARAGDTWSTAKLMWQSRLAAIEDEISAIRSGSPEPVPSRARSVVA